MKKCKYVCLFLTQLMSWEKCLFLLYSHRKDKLIKLTNSNIVYFLAQMSIKYITHHYVLQSLTKKKITLKTFYSYFFRHLCFRLHLTSLFNMLDFSYHFQFKCFRIFRKHSQNPQGAINDAKLKIGFSISLKEACYLFSTLFWQFFLFSFTNS